MDLWSFYRVDLSDGRGYLTLLLWFVDVRHDLPTQINMGVSTVALNYCSVLITRQSSIDLLEVGGGDLCGFACVYTNVCLVRLSQVPANKHQGHEVVRAAGDQPTRTRISPVVNTTTFPHMTVLFYFNLLVDLKPSRHTKPVYILSVDNVKVMSQVVSGETLSLPLKPQLFVYTVMYCK